jgi:transglutaminase-like putative cysteine protease
MPLVNLSHVTTYSYSQPAGFGEHRLMVRPRESYDQYLVSAELAIDPEPKDVRWLHDVFGNSVAIATFDKRSTSLRIENKARLLHLPSDLEDVHIEEYARTYPFTYSSEEMPDLLRSIERQHLDPHRKIDAWARRFVGLPGQTSTLAMLTDMTSRGSRRARRPRSKRWRGARAPAATMPC